MGLRDQKDGKKIGISGPRIYHVTTLRFRFNKKLNYKLAALEVFLSNRNAFASVVASLKIYCTSTRVILRTSTTLPELNNV